MLQIVQALDPVGVGRALGGRVRDAAAAHARAATPGLATALAMAASHLDLVAQRDLGTLRRELRVSDEELEQALVLVRGCHPRPGAQISVAASEYVVPDVFVRRTPGAAGPSR